MLNSDGSRLLTASDLLSFLGCHHSIFLDHMGARDPESPDKEDAQAQLINDKGNELESAHLDRLRNEGRKIVAVPPRLPLADRHALTLDAMRAGAEIVHGGVLCANGWLTRPDLLRRAESVSALGAHTDEPVHITLARTELARHVLQLAASSELLVHVQGCLPRAMGVVLADGRELELDPHHFTHYVRRAQRRLGDGVIGLRVRSGVTGRRLPSKLACTGSEIRPKRASAACGGQP